MVMTRLANQPEQRTKNSNNDFDRKFVFLIFASNNKMSKRELKRQKRTTRSAFKDRLGKRMIG